jgi:hypothetical protein
VKATKSATSAKAEIPTLASFQLTNKPPFFGQVFLVEEGAMADEVVDVTKFQSFLITIVLVVAYVAMAIHAIVHAKTANAVIALPDISGTFLVLLGISYAGYEEAPPPSPPPLTPAPSAPAPPPPVTPPAPPAPPAQPDPTAPPDQ